MLPHSRGTAHAHPPSSSPPEPAVFCLPSTCSSACSSETLPLSVAQAAAVVTAQQSSPSASSNASDNSVSTTIGPAASQSLEPGRAGTDTGIGAALPGAGTSEQSLRSRQRNRLQLRNAGFRATPITNRRVSPFSIFTPSRETSPLAVRETRSSTSQYPESSILQELHRSTRRKNSHNSRPTLDGLFEEEGHMLGTSSTTLFSNSTNNMSPRTEYLKRSPENDENAPPPSLRSSGRGDSPFSNNSSAIRGSKGRGSSFRVSRPKTGSGKFRSTSLQVTAYIDSLEAEIASLETRLSTLNSPSLSSVQSSKLRILTAENRNLKQEIAEWDTKFDERVQDAVYERTHFEADLQRRIRELEDEVRDRDERCLILEAQVKECEQRVTQAEDCERNMSRRVDLLSSMVAGDPSGAAGYATAPTTPMLNDFPEPLRPSLRIKSMLLQPRKVPPTGRSLSPSRRETITSAEDVFGWHAAEDDADTTPEATPQHDLDTSQGANESVDDSIYSTSHSDQQSILTASTQPTSLDINELRSPVRERPMSMLSTSSFSASWGLPASLGRSYTDGPGSASTYETSNKRPTQPKRTRRFHSSAGGLKPLILPSTASSSSASVTSPRRSTLLSPSRLGSVSELPINGYPQSAPVENIGKDHFLTPRRDASGVSQASNTSFDPTTAFFERSRETTPGDAIETPTLAARRRPREIRARELERLKALRQLEGDFTGSIDQMIADMSAQQARSDDLRSEDIIDDSPQQNLLLGTPGSTLAEELGSARPVSFDTVRASSRSRDRRSASCEEDTDGWAVDLISTPSTPLRSLSPALTETSKAPLCSPRRVGRSNPDYALHATLPHPGFGVPILQTPRISITQGTVSHASSESLSTEVPLTPDDLTATSKGLLERLASLASNVLPFRRSSVSDSGPEAARRTLQDSKPVLLARRILNHSWSRTAEGISVISPFRLGGLGWWLFGLLSWRLKQERDKRGGYQRLAGESSSSQETESDTSPGGNRPRQVSCGTEERQIGLMSHAKALSEHEFTPEKLRRLELDGPGECTMMRAEPHYLFDEHSAMLGLPPRSPLPTLRSYGSISSVTAIPTVESRANSAIDRIFGPTHMACSSCREPTARKRLRVWAKFGLALVLAVGVAVLEGPEAVMGEQDNHDRFCKHSKRDSEDYRDDMEEIAEGSPDQ